jgi:hypothetical protein
MTIIILLAVIIVFFTSVSVYGLNLVLRGIKYDKHYELKNLGREIHQNTGKIEEIALELRKGITQFDLVADLQGVNKVFDVNGKNRRP